ncbi:hypothetical protein B9Z55_024638 [Caenorhabditis nigoni]|nr:hypothetical protein B9Z55_024638 [Caenorhabditis nigoni]
MRMYMVLLLGSLLNCNLSTGLPTEKIDSKETEGSGAAVSDMDSNNVFNATSSENLQEKKSDSDNATSISGNDGISNPSDICGSSSHCYVFPENCEENCEVIYSVEKNRSRLFVRELERFGVISLKRSSPLDYTNRVFSCFETTSLCLYGYEDSWGVLHHSLKKNSMVTALSRFNQESQYGWTLDRVAINVDKEDKISFRIDPDREVSGLFEDLFLRSH